MYQKHESHPFFGEPRSVRRLSDGASIPFVDGNTDYADYLKWLAEGNTVLPPDEPLNA